MSIKTVQATLNKDRYNLLLNELASIEHELNDLRQILHSAPEAILITNLVDEIIYVNPAWEEIMGYSFDEVKDKKPNFLISGKDSKEDYKKLWKYLKKNQPYTNEKLVNKRKDKSEFIAYTTTFPVVCFNKPIYYVQFLHDITEEKKTEQERQELLSLVAHELKTPITVLKLLLSNRIKSKKKFTISDLTLMNKELDRLTDLINESLDISRIDSDRFYLNVTYFDLNQLIEEVFEQVAFILDGHKITIVSVPNLYVAADYNRIKQVLINFLTNAIKYSLPGTTIGLNVRILKKNIIVSVKDEGFGIPKDKLPFVFNKFVQVKKQNTEGLGLGLYISADIMHKHKGKIWVESKEGKGSTFYFSLPLRV